MKPLRPGDRLILASAALDSTALLKEGATGVAETVAGLAALLLAAKVLGKLPAEDMPQANILFVLFNGEAYDYIGSSRFAMDMHDGKFPHWAKYDVAIMHGLVRYGA
jgi:nicastrin